MNFLQQLDEAASIPLDQLKDKMKKDPRVKLIFTRSPQLDQIKDKAEFIKTLRYYVFSNPQVRAHIEKRADRRDVSKHWWKQFSTMKPTDQLTQMQLEWISMLVKDLIKDAAYVAKGDISSRAFEAFNKWFHSSSEYQLDTYTTREIDSLDLKPTSAVTLYRGVLFDERSLRSSDFSNSEGLKFLKSVREGTRVVDLKYDHATRWTTNKNDALVMALYGPSESWRKGEDIEEKKVAKYRGVLGFVVSTLATPDDILVEMKQLEPIYNWPTKTSGGYNSVVLKPGKFLSRIVGKYTPEGEEDPIPKKDDDEPDLSVLKNLLTLFGKILKLPFPEISFDGFSRLTHDPKVMSEMGLLLEPGVKERLSKLMTASLNYYKKHLEKLDPKKLTSQAAAEPQTFSALQDIHELFGQYITHKRYANPNAMRRQEREAAAVSIKDLRSADDVFDAKYFEQDLASAAGIVTLQKRFTAWNSASFFVGFAKLADPNYKVPEKIHLEGWKVQKELVDRGVRGFFMAAHEPMPETPAEQAKEMMRIGREVLSLAWVAKFLQQLKSIALSAGE